MVQEHTWEDKVEAVCLQLTPALLLASFESWRYPEGSSDEHRRQAAHRVEVIRTWVEEEVPKLFLRLHSFLDERQLHSHDSDISLQLKGCIVVACGVYISPRLELDGSSASKFGREPWSNGRNRSLAIAVLQHPLLSANQAGSFCLTFLEPCLVSYLLSEYLKPIFSSSPSKSINMNTGRAAQANVNLATGTEAMSGGSLLDDEVMWKGGDIDKSLKTNILASPVLVSVQGVDDITQKRHRALGCYNVLYICCDSLVACQEEEALRERWPLILPPLLTVIEDSSPLYRLVGSRILSTTLLSLYSQVSNVGSLLLQTGVAALLRQRLESNLTFISTDLSAALLQSSAETLLLLSQVTTSDMYQGVSIPRNIVQDGGKERFEQLSKLMDEGVIRVWAYAPSTVAAMELDTDYSSLDRDDVEASDVVNASINVLTRLTKKDALGVGMARYLDLTLEFLTGQMIGIEARLDRHKVVDQKSITLDREICSAKAVEALLVVCKQAPGVLTWSSRCLDAVARCRALLHKNQDNSQVKTLFSHLQDIVQALVDAHPHLINQQLQKLINLDKAIFASLAVPTPNPIVL